MPVLDGFRKRKRERKEKGKFIKLNAPDPLDTVIAANRLTASAAFNFPALRQIAKLPEGNFGSYGEPQDVFFQSKYGGGEHLYFKDNGSNILAVAHLDTVQGGAICNMVDTADGRVIFCPTLDDRLGAYTILDMLPALGIVTDVLLTTGEESCNSTAADFVPPRQYDWIFSFDRTGTDVVMYDYESPEYRAMLRAAGWWTGMGSFSDIAALEHLKVAGFNFGVGYRDYHTPRAHVWLSDYFYNIARFMVFHAQHKSEFLAAPEKRKWTSFMSSGTTGTWKGGKFIPNSSKDTTADVVNGTYVTKVGDNTYIKSGTLSNEGSARRTQAEWDQILAQLDSGDLEEQDVDEMLDEEERQLKADEDGLTDDEDAAIRAGGRAGYLPGILPEITHTGQRIHDMSELTDDLKEG